MVEQAINERHSEERENESFIEGGVVALSGTVFSTFGKIALAVGTTGLLMFLFMSIEAFIGLGTLYAGVTAIAGGLATMIVGNRLSNGFWTEGLLTA
mgnify:CR=1 FL=1